MITEAQVDANYPNARRGASPRYAAETRERTQFADLLKGPGMFWTVAGANATIPLRRGRLSGKPEDCIGVTLRRMTFHGSVAHLAEN